MTRGQESNARFGEDIGRLEQKPRLLSGSPIGDLGALIRPAVRGKMNRRGSSGTRTNASPRKAVGVPSVRQREQRRRSGHTQRRKMARKAHQAGVLLIAQVGASGIPMTQSG